MKMRKQNRDKYELENYMEDRLEPDQKMTQALLDFHTQQDNEQSWGPLKYGLQSISYQL